MFRRDKTPLSGALHRLFQRCFQAPAPVRGWRDYVTGRGVGVKCIRAGEGIAASNPPGHRWRRASAALDHATGQAVATSEPHQVNTTQRPPDPGPGLARGRGRGRATFATTPHSSASASTSKQPARPSLAQGTGCTRSRHRAGHGHQQPHQVNTAQRPPDPGPGLARPWPCHLCHHTAQQRQHLQATRPVIAGAAHRPHSITPPGRPWPPAAAPGQQAIRPDSSAAKGGAMGEPFSRPFPGLSIAGRGRAVAGTRQRTPGPRSVRPPTKAGRRAQHRARHGAKTNV